MDKVYLVLQDCYNDESCVVACFAIEQEAKSFCVERNVSRPYRFSYEVWNVGEVLDTLVVEPIDVALLADFNF